MSLSSFINSVPSDRMEVCIIYIIYIYNYILLVIEEIYVYIYEFIQFYKCRTQWPHGNIDFIIMS